MNKLYTTFLSLFVIVFAFGQSSSNDYPVNPSRENIGDGDRVYPGDGVAPITDIVKGFLQVGATPVLSLELFNKKYWAMPPLEAARIGIEKMKASVAPAL